MLHIGCSVQVVNWIMGCVMLVSFVVLINNGSSSFFNPACGLHQGFPPSSYLFILVEEGLSSALLTSQRRKKIQCINVAGLEFITHFLFIYDFILFVYGSIDEAKIL